MKPRVFVSSTFYDLKYIREELASYIRAHDFEPIMFENGDIGYTPGIPLDDSCYEAMRNADMALLIIGGQYGSPATGEDRENVEFLSVTRKEYEAAVSKAVPIYCFVDKAVLSEYDVYKLNKEAIDSKKVTIKFNATKNINVFKFIDEVYKIGKISVTGFEKADEIKEYLGKQWADMFKKYLLLLKSEQESNKLNQTVEGMNLILNQMKTMVNLIGKETIKNTQQYEDLLSEQQKLDVRRAAEIIANEIHILVSRKQFLEKENNITKLIDVVQRKVVNEEKEAITDMFNKINLGFVYFYSLLEIYDDTVIRCLKNTSARLDLIKLLQEDTYYNEIFSDDVNRMEKNMKWDKNIYFDREMKEKFK